MVAKREPQRITVEEWRTLERVSHDLKHEYVDGYAYAMSGGSLSHSRIGLNVCTALENALASCGKSCLVYNSDAAVRLSPRRYTYPDASVTGDERDQPTSEQTEIQFPRVIVEVLSDSTEAYDRGQKFGLYRACSYVQEYVLVATKYESVEVYRRQGQIWTYRAYGAGEEIELASLEIRVSLAALYRGVAIPVITNELEGEV